MSHFLSNSTIDNHPLNEKINVQFPIIGYVRSPLTQKFGIPRQPNLVALPSLIEFVPPYDNPQAFEGIHQFSHLWVLWQFHQNREQAGFAPQVRPPRLGGNDKLGVFATRSMYRPSNIGLSVVAFERLQTDNGVVLHITGGDMLDGTPVLDIKPYIAYSDSIADAKSGFAPDKPLQKDIHISEQADAKFVLLMSQNVISKHDIDFIIKLIAQDPRPAYRQIISEREFMMRYRDVDVVFLQQKEGELTIIDVVKIDNG